MVLVVFAVIAIIGQALNVMLCLALDTLFSPMVGALCFVLFYMLVFAGSWLLSVRIVEGWQRRAPERETWKPSLQARAR